MAKAAVIFNPADQGMRQGFRSDAGGTDFSGSLGPVDGNGEAAVDARNTEKTWWQ
jgi:hypothetical protein